MNNLDHEPDGPAANSGPSDDSNSEPPNSGGGTSAERKSRTRRTGLPPSLSFQEAVEKAISVYQTVGPEGSVEAMAICMGSTMTSSKFAGMTVPIRRHNLLNLADRTYAATEVLRALLLPESPQALMRARAFAFLEDKLMKAVFEKMKGEVLPDDPIYVSSIIQNNNIPQEFVSDWYKYFMEGGKYAGIFHEFVQGKFQVVREIGGGSANAANGVKSSDETLDIPEVQNGNPPLRDAPPVDRTPSPEAKPLTISAFLTAVREISQGGVLMVPEISNARPVVIMIPNKLTAEDVAILDGMLKGVIAMLPGLVSHEQRAHLPK